MPTALLFNPAFAGEPASPAQDTLTADDIAALDRLSLAFQRVAAVIKPSVVCIHTTSTREARDDEEGAPRRGPRNEPPRVTTSAGSGVIFDSAGHIVTSNHIIADAGRVEVELPDGRRCRARIIGADPMTDLALLKINADGLEAARFGDSNEVDVGHVVVAVGSPFRLSQTVSHGIVSAKGRKDIGLDVDYQNFIQTDCPISPGNSGGPLVNTRGQVIGINTAIATNSGVFAGVSFSTPSNLVVDIARKLMSGKPIVRGYLGIVIDVLTPEKARAFGLDSSDGVLIQDVVRGDPADRSGLRAEDVVLTIGGKRVRRDFELQECVASSSPGERINMTIWRGGKERTLAVTIGAQPQGFSTRMRIRHEPEIDNDVRDEAAGEIVGDARSPRNDSRSAIASLGLDVETLSPVVIRDHAIGVRDVDEGVAVTWVDPLGDAHACGLRAGFVILSADDHPTRSGKDLNDILTPERLRAGIRLRVARATDDRMTLVLRSE